MTRYTTADTMVRDRRRIGHAIRYQVDQYVIIQREITHAGALGYLLIFSPILHLQVTPDSKSRLLRNQSPSLSRLV